MRRIAVVAENSFDAKILIAAICQSTMNTFIRVNDKEVHIDMLEEGNEMVYGADKYVGALKSSCASDAYSLSEALKNPNIVPDGELGLSIRYDERYCERINLGCVNSVESLLDYRADAVIFVLKIKAESVHNDIMSKCLEIGIPMIAAGIPENWNQCRYDEPRPVFERVINDYAITHNIKYFIWYDPYGFNCGVRLSVESCKPHGVLAVFWRSVGAAAEYALSYLTDEMKKSQHTIKMRTSIFQRGSLRRNRELINARKSYAKNASEIVAAENLLELVNMYF